MGLNAFTSLVWAPQTFSKSSFESHFNHWVLVPHEQSACAAEDINEFEIMSSRPVDSRLRIVSKKANPFFTTKVVASNRRRDLGKV